MRTEDTTHTAYLFDAGPQPQTLEYIEGYGLREVGRAMAIVIDETRGKAKARFVAWANSKGYCIEYTTSMSCRKIMKVPHPPTVDDGMAGNSPLRYLWGIAGNRDLFRLD